MKISVSSYSFNQYLNKGLLDICSLPQKAKEMGFEGIEFIDITENNPIETAKKIKENADKCGISIIAYTIGAKMYHETEDSWQKEFDRLKGQIEIAKALGAPLLRHDTCFEFAKNVRSFDLMLPNMAKHTRKFCEYAKTQGIKTCSENHGLIAQDSDRVERLFNAVNHENYGLLVDFGNFLCVDEDSVHAVSRVAPYAFHVHAKDMVIHPDKPETQNFIMTRGANRLEPTYVGGGDVNVFQCLKIMKRAGYDGYVSIEFEGAGDCIEMIKKGRDNLKKYLSEIDG